MEREPQKVEYVNQTLARYDMLGKRPTIENDFFELGLEVFFSMSRGVFDQF